MVRVETRRGYSVKREREKKGMRYRDRDKRYVVVFSAAAGQGKGAGKREREEAKKKRKDTACPTKTIKTLKKSLSEKDTAHPTEFNMTP